MTSPKFFYAMRQTPPLGRAVLHGAQRQRRPAELQRRRKHGEFGEAKSLRLRREDGQQAYGQDVSYARKRLHQLR